MPETVDVALDGLPPSNSSCYSITDPVVRGMVETIRSRGREALPAIWLCSHPTPDFPSGGELMDGHHRVAAHRICGLTTIRAYYGPAQSRAGWPDPSLRTLAWHREWTRRGSR